jgi:nucleoside-diphosphate-sugar epimerase
MTTAAMVGAGLIGRSWAMVFARAGWRVRLFDSVALQLDAAREHIASGLAEQQQYGLADDAAAAFARVEYVADLEKALAGVDWVQENAPELLDVKRELYPRIDRATPKDGNRRQLHVGDSRVALHRNACRTRALPRRASGQSAASRTRGRALRAPRGPMPRRLRAHGR